MNQETALGRAVPWRGSYPTGGPTPVSGQTVSPLTNPRGHCIVYLASSPSAACVITSATACGFDT